MKSINSYHGFYKVDQKGGSLVVATLYNPDTTEVEHVTVRDYDYSDCSRDNDEIYDLPINEDVRREWLHHNGVILPGDTVEVVKGRKVAKGTIATVKAVKPVYDHYNRWVADYLYFTDGPRTNVENCVRVA